MTILELREKRAKAWEAAKAFLDSHRKENGVLSAEDDAAYTKMEQEITDLGKEIARLERQEALDAELNRPVNRPLTGKPGGRADADDGEDKTGRASDDYRKNFWNAMRSKAPMPAVTNALQVGTDSEGGYLVPDEYERTLVEALEEENIFRQMAKVIKTSSGDRKIPVVASKGTASWIDEEGAYPESDDSFGQVSIGAYKLGTMIKVSEELLNDSVFDLQSYISREFARRIGAKETCLQKFREDGEIKAPVWFNGVVRSEETVVLFNMGKTAAPLDIHIYPKSDMAAGTVRLAQGVGGQRAVFPNAVKAEDDVALLASTRECTKNGVPEKKEGFYQYSAAWDSKHKVALEGGKTAQLLFTMQEMQEGGDVR